MQVYCCIPFPWLQRVAYVLNDHPCFYLYNSPIKKKKKPAAAPVSCSAYGAHQGQSPLLTRRIIFNALTFLNLTIISAKWHASTLPSWGNTCRTQNWAPPHLVQNPILFHLASRKTYQPWWTETGQKVNCVLHLGRGSCLVKLFILQTFLYILGGKRAV